MTILEEKFYLIIYVLTIYGFIFTITGMVFSHFILQVMGILGLGIVLGMMVMKVGKNMIKTTTQLKSQNKNMKI